MKRSLLAVATAAILALTAGTPAHAQRGVAAGIAAGIIGGAIAGGALLLLVMMLGLFGSGATVALGSIAAVLGGIVSLGSNTSTLQQTTDAIAAAEAHRSELIGRIDLRVVGDGLRKLH